MLVEAALGTGPEERVERTAAGLGGDATTGAGAGDADRRAGDFFAAGAARRRDAGEGERDAGILEMLCWLRLRACDELLLQRIVLDLCATCVFLKEQRNSEKA